jgi:polar amino acid transport system substrate-binding protein
MNVDASYLVPFGSPIKSLQEVDRAGVRVSVQRGGTNDIYLTGVLKQAQLVRTDTTPGAFDLLRTGQVEAMAGDVPPLLQFQRSLSGSQILPGRFQQGHHVIGLPKGHAAGAAYVTSFVEQAIASGRIQQAIDHAALHGVEVAALTR